MTITLNNSFTDRRVRELFGLFMEGIINADYINKEIDKVYYRFFHYAREQFLEKNKDKNLEKMVSFVFNKNQRDILKWLKIKLCSNKHCSSWNEKLSFGAFGVSSCAECKIRKAENKLTCRLNKKIKQKVFEESESGSDSCMCSICFENFENASVLPCGHCFHSKCINHWLINNRENCPNCRLDLNLNLNVKYNKKINKKKTLKQHLENTRRILKEVEKKKRSHISRQNIRARNQMVINNNEVSYSNDRGFSYKRFGALFPYYSVVRIVKRRICDLRSWRLGYGFGFVRDWTTIRNALVSDVIIDETHMISSIGRPTGMDIVD